MDTDVAAQLAMTMNFITLAMLGIWRFVPWARERDAVTALTPLIAIHAARTVALQLFSVQENGYAIPDSVRDEIVWGDQLGAVLAILTLAALWLKPQLAKPLALALVIATVVDLANALLKGIEHELLGQATDVSWLILTFYVPLLWVSIGLVAWLLVTRGKEAWE